MRARSSKQALVDKGFAEEEFDILFSPAAGWEGLEEHHDFL